MIYKFLFVMLASFNFMKAPITDINDMISVAVTQHVEYEKSIHRNDSTENAFLFLRDNFPDGFVFSRNHNITFLETDNFSKSLLKKGLYLFRLLPIKLNENNITIIIYDSFFTKIGRKTFLKSGDYAHYVFVYSCEHMSWKLKEVKRGGI